MPRAHSSKIYTGPTPKTVHGLSSDANSGSASSPTKLRPLTTEESRKWSALREDLAFLEYQFIDLDDQFEYPFKDQDIVWVRTKEQNWCQGRVTGKLIRAGRTRQCKDGFYYPVNFGTKQNVRKYFAPTNGDIKPDTRQVSHMLKRQGYLNGGDDDDMMSEYSDSEDDA